MSKRTFCIGLLTLMTGAFLSGCASSQHEYSPEPKTVMINETNVWVSGYWVDLGGGKWVWVSKHEEARPRAGATWVSGHWDKSPDDKWVWTQGYWN